MNSITVSHAFVSRPGEGQALPRVGRVRVSSAQTGGTFEVIELAPPSGPEQAPSGGPPPHVHHEHEECFFIVEGTFKFVLGNQEVEAPAGSVVLVPRGTRHAFKRGEGARALVFTIPAGLEGFFRELSAGINAGRSEADLRVELKGKYDTEPIG